MKTEKNINAAASIFSDASTLKLGFSVLGSHKSASRSQIRYFWWEAKIYDNSQLGPVFGIIPTKQK